MPADVSLTVAVQVVGWLRPVGFGKHVTAVLVARLLMLKLVLVAPVNPELEAVRV